MAIEYLNDIALPRDPQEPLHAATRQFVEAAVAAGGGGGGVDPDDFVSVDGDTMTGDLVLARPVGEQIGINLEAGGALRWRLARTADPENPAADGEGSNLILSRYDNAGAWVNNVLTINRLSGQVEVEGRLMLGDPTATDPSHAASRQYVDNHNWRFNSGVAEAINIDLNDIDVTGLFQVNASANAPLAESGFLLVMRSGENQTAGTGLYLSQMWISENAPPRQYIRNRAGGAWSAWVELSSRQYVDARTPPILVQSTPPVDTGTIWIDTSP